MLSFDPLSVRQRDCRGALCLGLDTSQSALGAARKMARSDCALAAAAAWTPKSRRKDSTSRWYAARSTPVSSSLESLAFFKGRELVEPELAQDLAAVLRAAAFGPELVRDLAALRTAAFRRELARGLAVV